MRHSLATASFDIFREKLAYMESRHIVEASGQVVTVHKGWTATKAPEKSHLESVTRAQGQSKNSIQPLTKPSLSQDPLSLARVRRSTPQAPQTFEFVNGNEPFQTRDPDVSRLIRAHAMRDSARRKKKQRSPEKEKDAASNPSFVREHLTQRVDFPSGNTAIGAEITRRWITSEVERSYGVVPFARDPDPSLSAVIHDLINVSSRMYPMEGTFKFNPLSPAQWFHFARSDQALYHALQYTSASYKALYDGPEQSKRAALEMGQCMHLLNERLYDTDDIADGTIGATSCLALVEVLKGNYDSWKIHMAGLKQMAQTRGGVAALENPVLRLKLYRSDLTGSIEFLAWPSFIFVRSSKPTLYESLIGPAHDGGGKLGVLLNSHALQEGIVDAYVQMRHFSEAMAVALSNQALKIDPVAFVEDTYEIQYRLILFASAPSVGIEEQCLEEALRMGGLIYMKDVLREYPLAAVGTANLVSRMKEALTKILGNEQFALIMFWLCFIGGVSSKRGTERTWFIAQLLKIAMKLRVETWDEVRQMLELVMLIEKIHEESCKGLWEEVSVMRSVFSESIYF